MTFKLPFFRLAAYAIDFGLLAAILVLPQFLISLVSEGYPFTQFESGIQIYTWVFLTISLPVWFYFILMESSKHQGTLGKQWLKLHVENLEGEKINHWQAVKRTFVRLLPWELTHVSLIPIYFAELPTVNVGIWIADFLILIYIFALVISGGKWTFQDKVAQTKVDFYKS